MRRMAGAWIAVAALWTAPWAQVIQPADQADYPRLEIKPQNPSVDDELVIQVVKGIASNSCMAPTYKDQSFGIDTLATEIFPPQHILSVQYTEVPAQGPCTMVYAPVEYGPTFTLGELGVGSYAVADGEVTVGRFDVSKGTPQGYSLDGTVLEDTSPHQNRKYLANVTVYLEQQIGTLSLDSGSLSVDEGEAVIAPWPSYGILDSTTTDNAGEFSFQAVGAGGYQLRFLSRDHQARSIGLSLSSDTTLKVKLLPKGTAATVSGTVHIACLPDGDCAREEPLPGCTVRVWLPTVTASSIDATGSAALLPYELYTAVTGSDGRYAVTGIPLRNNDQSVSVSARKRGYAQEYTTAHLQAGQSTEVNFAMQKAYANSATVASDGVEFTVATDKAVYLLDGSIGVRYTVTNTSERRVTYRFNSGCQFDMKIATPGDNVIHHYMNNRECTDALTRIELEPGEEKVMDFPRAYLPGSLATVYPDAVDAGRLIVSAELIGYQESMVSLGIAIAVPASLIAQPKRARLGGVSARIQGEALVVGLPRAQRLTVTVAGLDGRRHATLCRQRLLSAGSHTLRFKRTASAQTIHLIRIRGRNFTRTIRALGGVIDR